MYGMPGLENVSFESTRDDAVYAFIVQDDFQNRNIHLEDVEGTMTPSGLTGFFVNNAAHMTAFINEEACSVVPGSSSLFCKQVCLRRMLVTTTNTLGYQMVVTSKADSTKSFVFSKAFHDQKMFDVVLPFDEYTVHFLDLEGEQFDLEGDVTLTFDDDDTPSCEPYITEASIDLPERVSREFSLLFHVRHLDVNNLHSSLPFTFTG